jgi:hypothetical protein
MRYHAHEFVHEPDKVKDIFDGHIYRSLLDKKVIVPFHHNSSSCYFEDEHDIALGFSTDGFGPFRRRKKTCWPLIAYNYNLPPDEQFHRDNILSLGVIPGPKKPHDINSFLWPMVDESLRLAVGIQAFDAFTNQMFVLRAFFILGFGDIPAMSLVTRMKGQNAISPCQFCHIKGVRVPGQNTYYIPLDRSQYPDVSPDSIRAYSPTDLPMRSHNKIIHQAEAIESAASISQAASRRLAQECGLNGLSILTLISSLQFPYSFPSDFMHLIFEDVLQNLILLWTSDFKGLNEGSGSYQFEPKVWEAIGKATADSGETIASCFGARPPNVENDRGSCTADSWSFWMLYIGPVLLRRRFRKNIYYKHFIYLVKLVNVCLQFEYSKDDMEAIHNGFVKWVKEYER